MVGRTPLDVPGLARPPRCLQELDQAMIGQPYEVR
jgi:hypothetical protein